MNYLCYDLGNEDINVLSMNEDGEIQRRVAKRRVPKSLALFLAGMEEDRKKVTEGGGRPAGIAVSFPGELDESGEVITSAGAYSYLRGRRAREVFCGDLSEVPLSVENSGRCAALAESWKGSLSGIKDGVVMILGTGISGGVIENGRIRRGSHGRAGELSYLILDEIPGPKGTAFFRCSIDGMLYEACRLKGIDVRKLVSWPIFSRFAEEEQVLSALNDREEYRGGMTLDQFLALEAQGDAIVSEIYDQFLFGIAKVVISVGSIYDPERICIGGEIIRRETFLADVKEHIRTLEKAYMGEYEDGYEICACACTDVEAHCIGALRFLLG